MDNSIIEIYRQAIEGVIPVSFYYTSEHSKYFPDSENPPHPRIVQPVCFGYRIKKNGEKVYYVRAFLLQQYSFSKNRAYPLGSTTKKYVPKVKQWRLYRVDKQTRLRLLPDYPQEYRAYVWNYSSYNADDSFFTKILFSIPQEGTGMIKYFNPSQPYNITAPNTGAKYSQFNPNSMIEESRDKEHDFVFKFFVKEKGLPVKGLIISFYKNPDIRFIGYYDNAILHINRESIRKGNINRVKRDLLKMYNYVYGLRKKRGF